MMLTTSMSQEVTVPNSVVVVPTRPYTDAEAASARPWATSRISSGVSPVAAATESGVNGAQAATTESRPWRCGPM